jgi:hypothetical protein
MSNPAESATNPPESDWDDDVPAAEEAPEKAAAPAEEPAPAPEPARPAHPRSLVLKARRLGYTAEEIAALSTADLKADVDAVEREEYLAQRERFYAEQRQQPEAPKPAEKPAPEPEADPLDFDAAEYEPAVAKLLSALRDKVRHLEKQTTQHAEIESRRQATTLVEAYDAAFEQVGDDRAGAGSGLDFAPGSPERDFRETILRATDLTKAKTARQTTAAIVATYRRLFGDKPAAPKPAAPAADAYAAAEGQPVKAGRPQDPKTGRFVPAEVEEEEAEREEVRGKFGRAGVAVPTHRAGAAEPKGVAKAKKVFAAGMRDLSASANGTVEDPGDEW